MIRLVRMAYRHGPNPGLAILPQDLPPLPPPGFGWVRVAEDGTVEDRRGPWVDVEGAYHDACTNAANWTHEVVDATGEDPS